MGNRPNYKRKHAVERSMPLGPAYGSGCVTRLDRDAPLFAFLRQHLRELSELSPWDRDGRSQRDALALVRVSADSSESRAAGAGRLPQR